MSDLREMGETSEKSATRSSEHFSLQTALPFTLPGGLLQLRQFNIQYLPFIIPYVSPPYPTGPGSDTRSINDDSRRKCRAPDARLF
jgi:hypothetical protein